MLCDKHTGLRQIECIQALKCVNHPYAKHKGHSWSVEVEVLTPKGQN